MLPNWCYQPPKWETATLKLLTEATTSESTDVTLSKFIETSNKFQIKFPTNTGRCETLKQYTSSEILERNINSTYPLIHENILELYAQFILMKRQHGTSVEKKLYEKMSLLDFIDRLITKRAVMFMGKFDKYLLLDGSKGSKNWELIGSSSEKPPLVLQNCLSYDELKLSVFLSVSSYTYFVNKGTRKNMAVYATSREEIGDEGVIVGVIGTRLKKENVMEFQELVVNSKQNTIENGYGSKAQTPNIHKLFSELYEEPCRDFEETLSYRKGLKKDDGRFTDLKDKYIFDNFAYYKRMTFTMDTLFLEANERAKAKGTTAYIHVVGLGLGVWKIAAHQDKVYMEIVAKRLEILGEHLHNISDVCFSYINEPHCGGIKHGELFPIASHPLKGIKIHIFKREPHEKLVGPHKGKLLVVSYAWDGNALPGNEFWDGKLGSSGDSAAASSTQITELHNPHINPKVSVDNLRIVTKTGLVTFGKYQEDIRCKRVKRK